jgi:small subunit ribosomal protein S29
MYTSALLRQILNANSSVLSKITLSNSYGLPIRPQGSKPLTLVDLCELGGRNSEVAWETFLALWKELTESTNQNNSNAAPKPPILFSLDGLEHVMGYSSYLTPDMRKIHAHDLALVDHFVAYLSGRKSLPNGGLVIAATTKSNAPASPATEFSIECNLQRMAGAPTANIPQRNPYKQTDERSLHALREIDVMDIQPMTRVEARAILEYYAASGMIQSAIDNNFVNDWWTLSGEGNIGELERGAVRWRYHA